MTAYKLIKDHKRLEDVVKKLEDDNRLGTKKRKWVIPEPFPYPDIRELFKSPDVIHDFTVIPVSIFGRDKY